MARAVCGRAGAEGGPGAGAGPGGSGRAHGHRRAWALGAQEGPQTAVVGPERRVGGARTGSGMAPAAFRSACAGLGALLRARTPPLAAQWDHSRRPGHRTFMGAPFLPAGGGKFVGALDRRLDPELRLGGSLWHTPVGVLVRLPCQGPASTPAPLGAAGRGRSCRWGHAAFPPHAVKRARFTAASLPSCPVPSAHPTTHTPSPTPQPPAASGHTPGSALTAATRASASTISRSSARRSAAARRRPRAGPGRTPSCRAREAVRRVRFSFARVTPGARRARRAAWAAA